jgi:hypothetical protein
VARDIRGKKLVAIEVTDAEPLGRSLDVIHSRHRPQSAEALAFLRTLQATVNAVAGAAARPRLRRR